MDMKLRLQAALFLARTALALLLHSEQSGSIGAESHSNLDPDEPWEVDPFRWESWLVPSYLSAFDLEDDDLRPSDAHAHTPHPDAPGGGGAPPPPTFDVPVFVMNNPRRPDRRRHMERLLPALGFTNVSFPPGLPAAGLDPDNLPTRDASKMNFAGAGAAKAWKDIWGCGQGIGAIREVLPVATRVERRIGEYRAANQRRAQPAQVSLSGPQSPLT